MMAVQRGPIVTMPRGHNQEKFKDGGLYKKMCVWFRGFPRSDFEETRAHTVFSLVADERFKPEVLESWYTFLDEDGGGRPKENPRRF